MIPSFQAQYLRYYLENHYYLYLFSFEFEDYLHFNSCELSCFGTTKSVVELVV